MNPALEQAAEAYAVAVKLRFAAEDAYNKAHSDFQAALAVELAALEALKAEAEK